MRTMRAAHLWSLHDHCGDPAAQAIEEPALTKRQCLTCGFYQPSGSDSMGWCNNPRRKIASDIRLYVRAHELPCRDSWDHDLWEDKSTFAVPTDVVLNNAVSPVKPASIDDLVFVASAERSAPNPDPMPVASESTVDRVIHEESASATITAVRRDSIRGSVRRAHQQVLAGKRTERFADGASSAMDGGFLAPVAAQSVPVDGPWTSERVYEAEGPDVDYAATRPAFNAVPPIQPNEMDRSMPKMAIYPSDEDRFSSVPRPVQGVQLPTRPRAERPVVIRSTFLENDGEFSLDPASTNAPAARAGESALRERRREDEALVPAEDGMRRPEPATSGQAGITAEAMPGQVDDEAPIEHELAPVVQPRRRGGLFRSRRRYHVEPSYDQQEPVAEARRVEEASAEPVAAPIFDLQAPARPASRLSLQAQVEEDELELEPIDNDFGPAMGRRIELWADVPRMCRTCRDFRPAESGERGWCNNKWAFNHRRMVDAEECPCESSVGCWWLPHDDVWLASSDISAHGQPTPLLDLWLGQRRGRDADEESASIGRRRRG